MQSSTSDDVPTELPVRRIQLPLIDRCMLKNEIGLKRYFMNVNVNWVTCPDLSKKPFNLAAPGLGGQTALIELGDKYYFERPKMHRTYNIKRILTFLKRDHNKSFIFGNGISERQRNGKLSELVMNASFSPATDGAMEVKNKSHLVFFEKYNCHFEKLYNVEPTCKIQGNFFLCEGSTTPVLEVRVKKYRSCVPPVPGFIDSMQSILQDTFGVADQFVALSGVYTANNTLWGHTPLRNHWEKRKRRASELRRYCKINVPTPIISTFYSNLTDVLYCTSKDLPDLPPLILNACQSTHSFFHYNIQGSYYFLQNMEDGLEFLGYFNLPEELYYIDELFASELIGKYII